jgi:sugar lactone lactonase YvrE
MKRMLLALAALAACTSAASGADGLRARVSPAPPQLAAAAWTPTIALTSGGRPARARLALTIRRGGVARSFAPRAVRRGRYVVRVVFPSTGRWAWELATGRRTLARGAITVTALVPFRLPYDLALEPDGTILFPDGGRVLALDPRTRRVTVRARTPSEELVALVRHADGTLYGADLGAHRILRVDPGGRVSTAAQVRAPADLVLHPDGSTMWVGSLEDGVHRVDVATGRSQRIDPAEAPHGIDRDAAGNLYFHDGRVVRRLAPNGTRALVADVDAFKLLVTRDGLYGVTGDPNGGSVVRIANGRVETVVGDGTLGPHRDGRAREARILPSAVALAPDGALLVSQVQPVPAIRRVDLAAGTIETLVRGG